MKKLEVGDTVSLSIDGLRYPMRGGYARESCEGIVTDIKLSGAADNEFAKVTFRDHNLVERCYNEQWLEKGEMTDDKWDLVVAYREQMRADRPKIRRDSKVLDY